MIKHITAVELLLCVLSVVAASYAPVIGITAQPTSGNDQPLLEPLGNSFIPASYVKWIEAAGGRVVPLVFDMPSNQLNAIMGQLNGLLFPGGAAPINSKSSKYANFSRELYDLAVKREIPLWGTCLGFEQLMVYSSSLSAGTGTKGVLSSFDAEDLFLPLKLTEEAMSSKLLGGASGRVLHALTDTNMTVNLHSSGITPAALEADPNLKKTWRVLATNVDRQGKEFVSLAEGSNYPIFASQFHPEKNAYEFNQAWDMPSVGVFVHSATAIEAVQWIVKVFVERARLNTQKFVSEEAFRNISIYNFAPIYTNALSDHTSFEQTYLFKKFE